MKSAIALFLLLFATGLSARGNGFSTPGTGHVDERIVRNTPFPAPAFPKFSYNALFVPSARAHRAILKQHTFTPMFQLKHDAGNGNGKNTKTPIWQELGYILAMETVFTGLSYLARKDNGWGPAVTIGFDAAMAVAGFVAAPHRGSDIQTMGHYVIAAGFAAKSLYHFRFAKNHSKKVRFWASLAAYNVLVFSGYYLDTLK